MKTWAKLMPVNIGLLRKRMYGNRDATSKLKCDWQRHMPNLVLHGKAYLTKICSIMKLTDALA